MNIQIFWSSYLNVKKICQSIEELYLHSLHYDCDAGWLNSFGDSNGDLFGESLLHLQPSAVDLNNTGQLAQPQDLLAGQITDGDFTVEGNQMVLAHGEHLDVLDQHHLIVILIKYGVVQDLCNNKGWFCF